MKRETTSSNQENMFLISMKPLNARALYAFKECTRPAFFMYAHYFDRSSTQHTSHLLFYTILITIVVVVIITIIAVVVVVLLMQFDRFNLNLPGKCWHRLNKLTDFIFMIGKCLVTCAYVHWNPTTLTYFFNFFCR